MTTNAENIETRASKGPFTIEDLPDEVLEFILGFLPPYKDIHDCMVVSKRWRRCVLNVTKMKQRNLNKAIMEFDIAWSTITPAAMAPTITRRYSHAAAIHDNFMYVFGGCTSSMTTFNDLWRLDLSKRLWVRPLTMGTYPAPKACSIMVCYKDLLVVFGGWTYPPSYPLHQDWHLFNELHTYDIIANKWTCINTSVSPPPTAGHSVSIHGNWMVVFGGLQRTINDIHSRKTNDIWKLNLDTWNWYKQETSGHLKPQHRYGQSQTALDDENILIMGGSGGPSIVLSDIWVLNMPAGGGGVWKWRKVQVRNGKDAPPNLWCNPVCKVNNKIIVLSKSRLSTTPPFMYVSRGVWVPPPAAAVDHPLPEVPFRGHARIDMADRVIDRDENVNGRRGTLKGVKRNNAGYETAAKDWKNVRPKRNALRMYVLDVAHALDAEPYVEWVPYKNSARGNEYEGPEETALYTLVSGKSELIMFGGIQKDAGGSIIPCTNNLSNQVSNSLHFITAPSYII